MWIFPETNRDFSDTHAHLLEDTAYSYRSLYHAIENVESLLVSNKKYIV